MHSPNLHGAGLGFRRDHLIALEQQVPDCIDFFEIAPENWIGTDLVSAKRLRTFTERYPFVCHGLSLSLGGLTPLNKELLTQLKQFMQQHNIPLYTEHLSWCSDHGQLYDLLPIPFTDDAIKHTVARIRQTQDLLGQRIGIENASFYLQAPISEMDEATFINTVLEEADCLLHLDVNNVYVNSVNHAYDPYEFLRKLPKERVVYLHMAGHYQQEPNLLIDTHGAAVIDPVWELLDFTYTEFGVFPTLLERDYNIPALQELIPEVQHIASLQRKHAV
ncbi:hypothetical protein SAMN05660964_00441 [Thiothrix caldifontis]|jgi:Uncharacterized protein conserved in bacteria|uniref:Uncharacterized protein n=1 Tax=Thiothrix caldifontis TaxID=525918 RepID=A0A1H3WIS1_9GAMM|nr:DUF692 domain-containing protein [Thiothrix caldifontis]SDZ86294.1 hypothetical protein SAMN05660964_00441 [Thiothrix caldifontis]